MESKERECVRVEARWAHVWRASVRDIAFVAKPLGDEESVGGSARFSTDERSFRRVIQTL